MQRLPARRRRKVEGSGRSGREEGESVLGEEDW